MGRELPCPSARPGHRPLSAIRPCLYRDNRKLFAYALIQWDDVSNTLQSNIRVDWIHTPGSDLFVVLDTGYRTGPFAERTEPRWTRRTGVVKLTYLRAF